MRFIPIEQAKPGMVLAYDIRDFGGRILIGGNCRLTDVFIERLQSMGYSGMYIEDELSEGIVVEDAISPQLRAQCFELVKRRDIDGCLVAARHIVEELLEKGTLSLDLIDLRSYDDYTYAHSVNVAVICCVIGVGMELHDSDLTELVIAALLHDLGKLAIPPEILNKRGPLTKEEYSIMKTHSTLSYEMISGRLDISSRVKNAVLLHHENVDGSGYPRGMDGEHQTLYTRILHVADVYDALISRRPYKNPYLPCDAAEYLMGACGIQFDQKVVEVLLRYVPLFAKGTELMLSDGSKGIVVENFGIHNMRPIVRLVDSGETVDLSDATNMHLAIRQQGISEFDVPLTATENERAMMREMDRKPHLLVVDDMSTNLQLLFEILREKYELTLVKSGNIALRYLEKNPCPDLILMDINMPDLNGIDTSMLIRDRFSKTVPIMFVSTKGDKETVIACRAVNASGYIHRPFNPVYLKSEISRVLCGWRDMAR